MLTNDINKGDIIPGRCIGEICINESEKILLSQIGTGYRKKTGTDCSEYEIGSLKILVDSRSKRVYQIFVIEGFEGALFNQVRVGSPFNKLKELGEVYYDLDVYQIRGIEGVCFEMSEDETSEDDYDVENTYIVCISVYDPSDREHFYCD